MRKLRPREMRRCPRPHSYGQARTRKAVPWCNFQEGSQTLLLLLDFTHWSSAPSSAMKKILPDSWARSWKTTDCFHQLPIITLNNDCHEHDQLRRKPHEAICTLYGPFSKPGTCSALVLRMREKEDRQINRETVTEELGALRDWITWSIAVFQNPK